ncbi:MAG: hypothetical protein ACHREM_15670 [Polyangiales bacterium]
MKLRTLAFTALAFLAAHTVSSVASAADKKKAGSDVEEMTFEDDKLLTSNLGPDQAKIAGRPNPIRTILVRPRVTFVPEMLKSIENL